METARKMDRELYIDLLKRCVGNAIYDDDLDMYGGKWTKDPRTGKFHSAVPRPRETALKHDPINWPTRAHTMIGPYRLNNLRDCVQTVLREKIPGDLIETGVWRGGASILMRGILKAYGDAGRRVWVADSFEGLPPVDESGHAEDRKIGLDRFANLAVPLETVRANFERYGLLDDQVVFLKGWFRDTLPTAPIEHLAVMRLDGDLYESTMDALTNLYPKLSPGGFVILDDYNVIHGCTDATNEFRQSAGIQEPLKFIEDAGAFWRKTLNP